MDIQVLLQENEECVGAMISNVNYRIVYQHSVIVAQKMEKYKNNTTLKLSYSDNIQFVKDLIKELYFDLPLPYPSSFFIIEKT